jgi:hypothetical protein
MIRRTFILAGDKTMPLISAAAASASAYLAGISFNSLEIRTPRDCSTGQLQAWRR